MNTDTKSFLSMVSGFLMALAYVPYIYAILYKGTKPVKVTWLIWATLDVITIAGMYAEDAINYQILAAGFGSWIIFFLSLRYGVSGWTKVDKLCLTGAFLGICIWYVFSSPICGVVASLTIMFVGSLPTFASAWKDPSRENRVAWSISLVSCVFAIAAIPHWILPHIAQPAVFLVITSVVVYIVYVRPITMLCPPKETNS